MLRRRWKEIVEGDLADRSVLPQALHDIDVAYHLIHSMAAGETFREVDRLMATNFGEAAAAGVKRITYLGGLGDSDVVASTHLVSRHEVGRALASGGVPIVEFRAALIIGSGSVSFEITGDPRVNRRVHSREATFARTLSAPLSAPPATRVAGTAPA